MHPKFRSALAAFGSEAKAKLSNIAAKGEPEDQLRAPLERLITDLAEICGFASHDIAAVGESSLSELKTRPDYAVTVRQTLVGFIEIKAPGKGADPRKFKDKHDKQQWEKLQSLPNLLYTDGNEFSLWRNGQLEGAIVRLSGDIETSGAELEAPASLQALFESFFHWQPIPPGTAKQLAEISARLCRFLRDEVTEQLALGSPALTALAVDWRKLLFPEATPEQFADGYAQAVTFGLLMARARDIKLGSGLDQVAKQLTQTHTLIGAALRLLTDDAENQATLKTSLGTLTRVLDAVHWPTISKGKADAWLYFYEDFLAIYDNTLRKKTGSYYTPPEVVGAMVRLVDETLQTRFAQHAGLASPAVTLADPAVGTGTFLLGVLRRIAETVETDEGSGSVPAAINAAVQRLVGFEMQLGPFAVAQLRILAEIADLTGAVPAPPRMFVTDTLSNPYVEEEWIPGILGTIAKSRKDANEIKKREPITVVLGNPPYKEKAKGLGGWVETDSKNSPEPAPLNAWIPPAEWGVSAHSKHLRNLYIYFWRWATWKVFDHDPQHNTGIVCFITVAGFLNGPGFERMRDYLRRTAAEIWVIDCSPEGHQPEVNTRIFEGVQQPVCIVLAARPKGTKLDKPAAVHFRALPSGHRQDKFEALKSLTLDADDWAECSTDWRAPFLPAATGAWANFPLLTDLFVYNGSGTQPKRTWVIAPDAESLEKRWQALINAPVSEKEDLFHATLRDGKPADRHIRSVVKEALPGYEPTLIPLIDEKGPCHPPVRYAYRSFNRQWIIPDLRVITQPNAELWASQSDRQVYITALTQKSPESGPAITMSGFVPDLDHYKGSFAGRIFPLWHDRAASMANLPPNLLAYLSQRYQRAVIGEDLFAYIAAIAAHSAYTARFQADLVQPGLRIPLTADAATFAAAAELGRTVIWLHTFGERFADAKQGRPAAPPRLPADAAPRIPKAGAIPQEPDAMPDTLDYDEANQRLNVGSGYIERVTLPMWRYEVSGKQVLRQWFSYRKANRERPIIGDRRPPSKLGEIQPDHWLAEYTTELLNVLHVLGRLIELEPAQAELLEQVCAGNTITLDELKAAQAFEIPADFKKKTGRKTVTEQQGFNF